MHNYSKSAEIKGFPRVFRRLQDSCLKVQDK